MLSAKIIGALPLEKVEGKSALLKRWSVKELAEVKANHAANAHTRKRNSRAAVRKRGIGRVVLSLRGDPMCSVCFEQFVEGEYVSVLRVTPIHIEVCPIDGSRPNRFGVQCVNTRRTRDECVFLAFLFVFTQST